MGDDARRRELIARFAADLDGLLEVVERERASASGADAEWFDELLAELRPLTEQARDLEAARALYEVGARHGGGPWPLADLATVSAVDPDVVRRVLAAVATPPADRSG